MTSAGLHPDRAGSTVTCWRCRTRHYGGASLAVCVLCGAAWRSSDPRDGELPTDTAPRTQRANAPAQDTKP